MTFDDPIPGLLMAPTTTGIGIVTHLPIRENQLLYRLKGCLCSKPTQHSVQIAPSLHIRPDGASWGYINHACDPNLVVDVAVWRFRATRDIAEGEELRFNYLTTERVLAAPFDCRCGARRCFGFIGGYARLGERHAPRERFVDNVHGLSFDVDVEQTPGSSKLLRARFGIRD